MKTLKKMILASGLILSLGAQASNTKTVKEMDNRQIDMEKFNIPQFGKYLQDGLPHEVEGVYKTKDGRYTLAIVRNEDSTHDFIAIVLDADNPFWKTGEVKFNFVLSDINSLEGLYYNSKGESVNLDFSFNKNGLKSDLLIKVDPSVIRANGIAEK